MKNYVVVFRERGHGPAFVKGDSIRFQDGQLQIISEERGLVYSAPLDLIHHANIHDPDLVTYNDPQQEK